MSGFQFESNLEHQTSAVAGVMQVLDGITLTPAQDGNQNPTLMLAAAANIIRANLLRLKKEREFQQNPEINAQEPVFDISMETGTGKTYAYTKTMFELARQTGLAKFIIAVPSLSIKAGTVSFLKSDAARAHFRDEYGRELKVHEVSSQKSKGKKEWMPSAIAEFVCANISGSNAPLQVLVINAQMAMSDKTMAKAFDVALFDKFRIPRAAVAHTKPILIIDEPHKFKRGNQAYKALMAFKPQFTLRYGATFDGDLMNMVNELTAVQAFNSDLVKGVRAHVENFAEGEKASLKLIDLTGSEAVFELNERAKSPHTLTKGESFESIHPAMTGLFIDKLNKSKLVLSNGLELRRGAQINPYSYERSLQEQMIQSAVRVHFETERDLYLASPRIKPLTLFFIDDIDSYRNADGAMRLYVEDVLKGHIEALIKDETDAGYKKHLQAALRDINALHGGYFSKDNKDSDEAIEAETKEILHDKEKLLRFDNPRRFIFSKWTLREGWDNPNVFTICKLRSSGSETSKLQEVGRGLRLPVTEHMTRDKSKPYYLNYFVDFTESDFAKSLENNINGTSSPSMNKTRLDEKWIKALLKAYNKFENEDELLEKLDDLGIIKRNNDFKDDGYEKLIQEYPLAKVKSGKIARGDKKEKTYTTIRKGKYNELKALWEALNKKVILEYNFDDITLADLFKGYMQEQVANFEQTGAKSSVYTTVKGEQISMSESVVDSKFTPIKMMRYQSFLYKLADKVALSVDSLHGVFNDLKNSININQYLSQATIRTIIVGFNTYLMQNAFGKFQVGYSEVSNAIHPTAFTSDKGIVHKKIPSANVGTKHKEGKARLAYLFDEIYYDGDLELQNIEADIQQVVVYSKIPKNSIRIPLVGGTSYSPDFAYVIKTSDGKNILNLVVETKGKVEDDLGANEKQKIEHAKRFFNDAAGGLNIYFETQLKNKAIQQLIEYAIKVQTV